MRPVSSTSSLPGRRPTASRLWFKLLLGLGVAATLLLFVPVVPRNIDDPPSPSDAGDALNPACRWWDNVAIETLSQLARSGSDSDLRQASDLIVRLQRARRNCRTGGIELASEDYREIGIMRPVSVRPAP